MKDLEKFLDYSLLDELFKARQENNARMAATAVRGDKTGTVERILMANEE